MLHIAICDDDEFSVKQLRVLVCEYARANTLSINISTFLLGVDLLNNFCGYDLIFLDIDMPQMNGIEVASKISESNVISKIIYVTNHKDYMKQAFSVHPFGYITKPIIGQNIFDELDEFLRRVKLEKLQQIVCFQNGDRIITLNRKDILYFEYVGKRRIKLTTFDDELTINYELNEVFKMVEKYNFAMPHQSFIINLFHVQALTGMEIVMKDEHRIPIAQKRAKALKLTHSKFLQSTFESI